MNIKGRMIVMPLGNSGVEVLVPFIVAVDHNAEKHVACWLEWCEGEFDPSIAIRSMQPKASTNNVIGRFARLPALKVRIAEGKTHNTFRAVCDRSIGTEVGVIACDGGTLWTVLPT